MNLYSLPASIALAVNIALGLIIFSHNPKKSANRLFTLLVGSMAVWNVGIIIMSNAHSQLMALLGAKLTLMGIFIFPVFFLHFTFVFPRKNRSKISPLSHPLLFYIPPVAILILILLKMQIKMGRIHALNIFYLGLHDQTTGFYIAYFVIMGMFLLFIIYGIVNLAISLKNTAIARQRLQIRYLIFGIILMAVFGGIIDLVNYFFRLGLPLLFITGLYTVFISIFFGIAIVKYRLLDIEIIIKRSLLFSTLSVLVLTVYILIVKHLSDWLGATTHRQSIVVESLFVLVIVIFLMPVKRYIERLIDHFVFPGRTKIQKRMLAFTKTLAHHIKLDELCSQIIDFVEEIFKLKKIAIFLWDETEECYIIQCERNIEAELVLHPADINRWLAAGYDDAIQVENIDENVQANTDLDALHKSGIFLLVPIRIKDELLGCLALGKRRPAAKWEMQDMEFLNTLANQAAIAISRTLIYEKEQQSERQLLRTEKLVAIGTLSAGMAHEIKNPLHIISGSAETLMNKALNKDEQKEILQFIVDETDRLNGILNNFLDFARPKKPEILKYDVVSLVNETLQMVSEQAKTLNITIKKHYAKGLPPLYFDPEQLKQVLINIELNALEAMSKTEKRMLTVKVSAIRNKQISISIKDTGIGIKKTIQSNIFDPFFTTKKNGTGLGLSISHQIMESMGGTISFVSNFGKGTTFTLKLPIQERLN